MNKGRRPQGGNGSRSRSRRRGPLYAEVKLSLDLDNHFLNRPPDPHSAALVWPVETLGRLEVGESRLGDQPLQCESINDQCSTQGTGGTLPPTLRSEDATLRKMLIGLRDAHTRDQCQRPCKAPRASLHNCVWYDRVVQLVSERMERQEWGIYITGTSAF